MTNTFLKPYVLIVCNALDDFTRSERCIETDSPAASRKVFMMAHAMRINGIRPIILSLGRGKINGSWSFFRTKVCRVNGIPIIYSSFAHVLVISQFMSIFGLLNSILRYSKYQERAVIFYNRMPAYILLLRLASLLQFRCFLDIEDKEVDSFHGLKKILQRFIFKQFELFCSDGVLLACRSIAASTAIKPSMCYYGTAVNAINTQRWKSNNINCLISGTLNSETGMSLMIEAINIMRLRQYIWARELNFIVTGGGDSLLEFKRLSDVDEKPSVVVRGRVSSDEYLDILNNSEVGLSLKPVGGALADSTFPSKVIEFASHGLLVLATDISDVRLILGAGAKYLVANDVELLIQHFNEIMICRQEAQLCANLGSRAVQIQCSPASVGKVLTKFLFGNK